MTNSAETLNHSANRTFVCSVLFLDIEGYSKRSVAEQMEMKQRFNRLLENALRQVVIEERIVLDTGDGAAVSFLSNPEDALFSALSLRDALAEEPADSSTALRVRMGINLGPVRLLKDLNGQANIIGDGINAAQRVMSFAEPGIILVSRSYHEVVSRLSDDFARMFSYGGTRLDKHVREHSLFAIMPVGAQPDATPPAATPDEEPAAAPPVTSGRSSPRQLAIAAALGLVIIAGGLFLLRTPVAATDAASDKAAASPEINLDLAISPWGEVFVDGTSRGVSPPLNTLALERGYHRIEIRNGSLPAHVVETNMGSEPRIAIRHKF